VKTRRFRVDKVIGARNQKQEINLSTSLTPTSPSAITDGSAVRVLRQPRQSVEDDMAYMKSTMPRVYYGEWERSVFDKYLMTHSPEACGQSAMVRSGLIIARRMTGLLVMIGAYRDAMNLQ